MRYRKNILTPFLLLTVFAASIPSISMAQTPLPNVPGPANIQLVNPAGFMPTVPTSNPAYEAKETGISLFGVSVPISWDSLTIAIAKKFIERMVDSTVTWINSGRDGNPSFVTDPKQYFTDIADGVAGEFILGSDLNFLCSPFQANIRLSLTQQFHTPNPFQCTLTEVVGNIDNFYNDFSQGGWDAWFSMTQNSSNNPYGAYLEAKIELDSRIASAIGIEQEKLSWGNGFISWSDCIVPDPLTGECLKRGPIKTPGIVLEGQLENVLGTGLRQLELADEFDELIGALLGQLLQGKIFNSSGLTSGGSVASPGNNNNFPPPGPVVCPIPTTPRSMCENVDRDRVMEILNKYEPSNPGIEEAIVEVKTVYPDAFIIPHDTGNRALDKIDFGGGLIVDVIEGAVNPGRGVRWVWGVECECGGPVTTEPVDPNLPI